MRALEAVAVSAVARVEVPAALWRKHRLGELSAADAGLLVRAFEVDFRGEPAAPPRFAAIAPTSAVLGDAASLTGSDGLRAYDAIQLASAMAGRGADPGLRSFACFDDALRSAAARRGWVLLPA